MPHSKYDFSGWVTVNDLECADGRVIRHNAFADNDGVEVPLVWNHQHNDVSNVLGKCLLKNKEKGVYGYGSFNDTERGQNAKKILQHGDIVSLSIFANQLKHSGNDVLHGNIREVSLVLAGANPGALIENVTIAHGDDFSDEEAVIYTGMPLSLLHSDENAEKEDKAEVKAPAKEDEKSAEAEKSKTESKPDEKTVKDVFNTFTDEQKQVVYFLIGAALENSGSEETEKKEEESGKEEASDVKHSDEGETEVKRNVFDKSTDKGEELMHSFDMAGFLADAKRCGSMKEAYDNAIENGTLAHAFPAGGIPTEGMVGPSQTTANQTYGFRDPDMLFPDYRSLNTPPEWIKRDTGWVTKVINGAHHTPFSRIKSQFANLTEDEARARGYMKGKEKKEQVFTLLKRTTDPQTIYKKQKMDRDDIIDITDFDVVAWIKGEMRGQLEEEIARAILIGDGRLASSDDKIHEAHVRPIATDEDLFTVKADVTPGRNEQELAKNFITTAIRQRKYYKGSGQPTLFTTEDVLTSMLLIEDGIGHLMYSSVQQLATVLRVKEIVTVEVMEGVQINSKNLLGIFVNMADYNIGADKGGAVELFDDFDIDYNQYKYLIETRISGALVKPFSAIVLTQGSNT